ncbi:Wadjet anti-phage system protein JetD domain-containing protein [Paraliobacillus sp. JSM ZJ581]|uniref:Wadjet anti-phage system protein JetD domain-containing protein n=1 Tax=Paraliobacillus sp. JSM ZJ581 TaxID=3342118 RepID=UPI0035A8AF6F
MKKVKEVKEVLTLYQKKTIDINTLQELISPFVDTYEAFANVILLLEEEEILTMVKSKGRSIRKPSLALQYRIHKAKMKKEHHSLLQQYRVKFHNAINLDYYYNQDPKQWHEDFPYLNQINNYLQVHGFPIEAIPAPERSYELVEDEKWITEKRGKEVLERVDLFDKMRIIPVSDPFPFAINPNKIQATTQLHLIVENKTTYQGLLLGMGKTNFSTLIYGSGKAIIQSIEQFDRQYPIDAHHHFFYFGDIDREGITIWHSLNKKINARLALPFYQACLAKNPAKGKDYQRQRMEAEGAFFENFNQQEQLHLKQLLKGGYYYPQEILKTKELQKIWGGSDWDSLILQ